MKIIKKTLEFRHLETSFPKALGRKKKVRKKKKPFKEGGPNRIDTHPDPAPTVKERPLLYQSDHK